MAKALRRILRFRQLAEEQARLEVERAAQLARRASAACEQQAALEHQQRSTLAESWIRRQNDGPENKEHAIGEPLHSDPAEEKGWLMEEAVLEFFGWKRMRLEELREAELRRMEPLIENYTERRRELRQTEQLVEQRAAIEAMEQNRRAQTQTDEWFSQRTLMQRRRDLHRTQPRTPEDSGGEAPLESKESVLRQF
jgi:hypothetical protein